MCRPAAVCTRARAGAQKKNSHNHKSMSIRALLRLAPRRLGGARAYHEKVIDHYQNPRNVGKMNESDQDVGTGLVGAPACGDGIVCRMRRDIVYLFFLSQYLLHLIFILYRSHEAANQDGQGRQDD